MRGSLIWSLLARLPVLLAIETNTEEPRAYMRPQHWPQLHKPELGTVETGLNLFLQCQSGLNSVGMNHYGMDRDISLYPLPHKLHDIFYSPASGPWLSQDFKLSTLKG